MNKNKQLQVASIILITIGLLILIVAVFDNTQCTLLEIDFLGQYRWCEDGSKNILAREEIYLLLIGLVFLIPGSSLYIYIQTKKHKESPDDNASESENP